MLDIRLIRDEAEEVKRRLGLRGGDFVALVDAVLAFERDRRAAETRLQALQAERKRLSKEIGMRRSKGEDTAETEASVRSMGDEMDALQESVVRMDASQRDALLHLPNLPHAGAPVGADAEANPEVRRWGAVGFVRL